MDFPGLTGFPFPSTARIPPERPARCSNEPPDYARHGEKDAYYLGITIIL